MKMLILAAPLCAIVMGCASYTENGMFGGFTETPLASDTYRIHANGNALTSRNKTNAIALVRAAELAANHGYSRFVILDYDEWTKTSYYTTPATATTSTSFDASGHTYGYGGYYNTHLSGSARSTTTVHPGQTYAIEKPRTDIVVRFVADSSPEALRALSVADILSRYGDKAGFKGLQTEGHAIVDVTSDGASSAVEVAPVAQPPVVATTLTPPPEQGGADRDTLTLDQLYKMLSPPQRAEVDRLPPSQRADYLQQIRERITR